MTEVEGEPALEADSLEVESLPEPPQPGDSTEPPHSSQLSVQRESSGYSPPHTPTADTPPETPTPRRPKPAPPVPGGVVPVRRKPTPRFDELKKPDAKGNDYSGKSSHQVQETDELKEIDTTAKLHFRGMTTDFPAIFQQATLGVKHVNAFKEAVSRLSKMEQEHAKKLEKLFSEDTKKIAKLMEGDGIVLFSGVWNELMMVVSDKFECTKQAAEQANEEVVKPCTELEKENNTGLKAVAAFVKQQERDLKKCTDSLAESRQETTKTLELMRSCNDKEKSETNPKKKAEWTAKHASVRVQAAEQAYTTEQRVVEVNKQSHVFENEVRNALDQLEEIEQRRVRQLQSGLDTYLAIVRDTDEAQLELSSSALEIVREMNPVQSMQTFKFDWLVDFGDPPALTEFTYDLPLTFDEITAGATLTKGLQMFVIEDSDCPSPSASSSIPLPVDGKAAFGGLARSQSTMSVLKRQETKSELDTRAIYVVGGSDGSVVLNSVERYDNSSGKWEFVTPLSTKRTEVALAGTLDGKLYSAGGTDETTVFATLERFDPLTSKWTKLADMATKRQGAAAVVVDNKLFVIGGYDGGAPTNTVEMFDPLHNKWKKMADMSFKRQSAGVAAIEGKIYVTGGSDGKERLASLECYELDKNKWKKLADMNVRRYGAGVAALEGKLYVAGGSDGTKRFSSAERYDPKTNRWEKIADMTSVRTAVGLVVMGGQLYAVGGFDGTSRLGSTERYDIVGNKWELLSISLGSQRNAHGTAAL